MDKTKKKKNLTWFYVVLIIVIIIVLDFALLLIKEYKNKVEKVSVVEEKVVEGSISIFIPAIDSNGNGVSTLLNVDIRGGNGRTLVDIDNLLFWADTQQSIRMAKLVAENVTGKKVKNYDLIYSIEANASAIGGPSAGAALTIATIAALENKKPKRDVMITGTINHDGSLGPVSEVYQKAIASKEQGAKIFLVPLLQSIGVVYETDKHCERFGFTEVCTTETKPRKINISKEVGIEVIEIENIKEAMNYFFDSE